MPWSRLRACKAAIASPTGLPEAGPTWSRLRSRTHTSYTYPGSTQPGTGPFHIRSCTSQTSAPDSTALPRPPSWACPGPLPRALWPPPLSRHFQPGAQRTRLGLAASGQPGRASRPYPPPFYQSGLPPRPSARPMDEISSNAYCFPYPWLALSRYPGLTLSRPAATAASHPGPFSGQLSAADLHPGPAWLRYHPVARLRSASGPDP